MSSTEIDRRAGSALTTMDEINTELARMLATIPEAEDDGGAGILAQILAVQSPHDLDAPWTTEGFKALLGKRLRFETLKQLPSDYEGGPGVYLIAGGVDLTTGEPFTGSTSSAAIMTQLITAYARRWWPLIATPQEAKRATKKGYKPMRLEIDQSSLGPRPGSVAERFEQRAAAAEQHHAAGGAR